MTEFRQITDTGRLDYKIMDYRMMEGMISVACIDLERLTIDGLKAYRMQAYATKRAVEATFQTGLATFWARNKQDLWTPGSVDGNTMAVRGIYTDCDRDSLVYDVDPAGPSCYKDVDSCFERPESEN